MSGIFPKAYAAFFCVQIATLMVSYVILRLKTKLKIMTTVCFSVLIVAVLTLLLLCLDARSVGQASRADIQEYAAGTFIVAAPFILILIVTFLTPLLRETVNAQKPAGPERTRILKMVEEGKITSEEGSDLLDAMGKSNALRGQDSFSRLDIAILGGVALVVMGFFLPWVQVRISNMSGMAMIPDVFKQNTAYQAGYHTGGLGWTIFVIALISLIPVFITPKNFLYKISILHLFLTLVGLLLVLSILLRAGSHLRIGIIVCTIGFTIELIASGAKFKRLAA